MQQSSVQPSSPSTRIRPWDVIHACEYAREVLDTVECQLSVGMRPYILTPSARGSAATLLQSEMPDKQEPHSLLTAWNEVRHWRHSFDEIAQDFDLVHAHCFAAGMAGVRSPSVVVYDMECFIEDQAPSDSSWMARSFRVAEHFILSRAAALIVHTPAMKEALLARGVSSESVFYIPAPMAEMEQEVAPGHAAEVVIWAPDAGVESAYVDAKKELAHLFASFEAASRENKQLHLYICPDVQLQSFAREMVNQLVINDRVSIESTPTGAPVADLTILGSIAREHRARRGAEMLANTTLTQAMRRGAAVLVADSPSNRNVSSHGEGVLWYTEGEADLTNRIAALARDESFRHALANAAREYVSRSCNYETIAEAYDNAYRYALQKRAERRPPSGSAVFMQPYPGLA